MQITTIKEGMARVTAEAPREAMYGALFRGSKQTVLLRSGILIAIIAILDWRIVGEIPLGALYLIPMMMLGGILKPWQIVTSALACTFLAESFDDLAWNLRAGSVRDVLYFVAFTGAGLFVREINRNRQVVLRNIQEIQQQSEARRAAEEQLRVLVETSPAAIVLADAKGVVLMANEAAHRMLVVPIGELPGRMMYRYLPSLRNVSSVAGSHQSFRTVMQAKGQREDGESFLADISFSTYKTNDGLRLAAMVMDASEELRSHEVSGLHQLLAGSRIAIGAVSHEIRNICGAIAAVHQNLVLDESRAASKDFEALGHLISGLEHIANLNLRQSIVQPEEVDLAAVIDEVRIVMSPSLQEERITSTWNCEPDLPPVWADRASLMQVFLNLLTNSIRALASRDHSFLSITARACGNQIQVEVTDNGGGVKHPEHLFRPFQDGADSSGLGLFISRAFLRSFGGELRYSPTSGGSCFVITLNAAMVGQQVLL